jgi:nitroreductase
MANFDNYLHTPLEESLRQRYGTSTLHNLEGLWNDCLSTLLSHRSIRSYLDKPLPIGTLETLVAAAQSASTSSNLQTWSVVAVEDRDRKARLSQLAGNQAHIRQCPLFLVWLADLVRLAHIAEKRGLPYEGLDYLEMFVTAVVDAALAAQNAAIAAESLGLGTVYIGGIRNHPEAVAAELKLPPRVFAVFGLCVGYPDMARLASIKPRLPQTAVLHHEIYSLENQDSAIAEYNQKMAQFYQEQQMNVQGDWTHHSVERIKDAAALKGRDRLREVLQQLGFSLR